MRDTSPSRGEQSETFDRAIEARLLAGLDFLWLELTRQCNLTCTHCYAESDPKAALRDALGLEDWKNAIRQASDVGCRKLQFIGGEPTLHPDLAALIELAHDLEYELIEVFTNGTQFTPQLKECFRQHHVHLAFSVYSSNPTIHDSVTMRVGSMTRTTENIRWAIEAGLPIRAGIIDVGTNSETLAETRAFLEGLGVRAVSVDRLRGIGRGVSSLGSRSQIDELCGACWEGKLCVTSSGSVFPCVFARFVPIGDAREGLATLLRTDTLTAFRSNLKTRAQQIAQCYPNRTCSPATSCGPEQCNPKYDSCNPKCLPHTCGPNCNPNHEGGNCEPTCKPSYKPFG